MNEKHVRVSIIRKLLRWLLGGFVALIAVAVLLVSMTTIAVFGIVGFRVSNHEHQPVKIVDMNASNGLIFFDSPKVLTRHHSSMFSGLLPFENFTVEVVIDGRGMQNTQLSCKLNRRSRKVTPGSAEYQCVLTLSDGSLSCKCYDYYH